MGLCDLRFSTMRFHWHRIILAYMQSVHVRIATNLKIIIHVSQKRKKETTIPRTPGINPREFHLSIRPWSMHITHEISQWKSQYYPSPQSQTTQCQPALNGNSNLISTIPLLQSFRKRNGAHYGEKIRHFRIDSVFHTYAMAISEKVDLRASCQLVKISAS